MGENVRQVLDYVARGEVDAGIVDRDPTCGWLRVRSRWPRAPLTGIMARSFIR